MKKIFVVLLVFAAQTLCAQAELSETQKAIEAARQRAIQKRIDLQKEGAEFNTRNGFASQAPSKVIDPQPPVPRVKADLVTIQTARDRASLAINYKAIDSMIPDHWSELFDSKKFSSRGPLQVITDDVIKLSQDAEILAHTNRLSQMEFDKVLKTLPEGLSNIAEKSKLFQINLDPIFQTKHLISEQPVVDLANMLKQEQTKSLNPMTTNQIQVDLTLNNGQKISVFGGASSVQTQLADLGIVQMSANEIASIKVTSANDLRMKAFFAEFNKKNGKVTRFGIDPTPANFNQFSDQISKHNSNQKPNIKISSSPKLFGIVKGNTKSITLGAALLVAFGAANAGQESGQAEAQLNSGSKKSAPKIDVNK